MSKFGNFITANGFVKAARFNKSGWEMNGDKYIHDNSNPEGIYFVENYHECKEIIAVGIKDKRLSHQQNLETAMSTSFVFALCSTFTNLSKRYDELHSIMTKSNDATDEKCKAECEAIQEYMKEIQDLLIRMDQFKAVDKRDKHVNPAYEVGDILVSSCGPDSIVSFYVVRKTTPKMVTLMKCGSRFHHYECQDVALVPIKEEIEGEELSRKVDFSWNNAVKINECETAFKWTGEPAYQRSAMFGR